MSDRTPADIIAEQHLNRIRVRLSIEYLNSGGRKGEDATGDDWEPNAHIRQQVQVWTDEDMEALAAAGFRVTPIPDDNTRALAARLTDLYKNGPTSTWRDDVRAAAAYLDGQPQDRPATCPTCGSSDPAVDNLLRYTDRAVPCSNRAWHVGGSGDTR